MSGTQRRAEEGTESETLDAIVRHASHLWLFLEQSYSAAIFDSVEYLLGVILLSSEMTCYLLQTYVINSICIYNEYRQRLGNIKVQLFG